MTRLNSRAKGASGEREAAKWLQALLSLPETPERNLEQVRHGGADLMGVGDFVFEVKRVEKLDKRIAWQQVEAACKGIKGAVPVVLFRKNRQPWRILISALYTGLSGGFVELDNNEAQSWLQMMYENFVRRESTVDGGFFLRDHDLVRDIKSARKG